MLNAVFADAYHIARRAAEVRSAGAMSLKGSTILDREDLEQEAMLGLWRALPVFDPSRATLRTFVERVIATKIASVVRGQRALRRVPARGTSPQAINRVAASIELRRDVERALGALSDGDRALALLLMQNTPTEASSRLRVSRSTVYQAIWRIRIAFTNAGLGPHTASRA